MENILFLVEMGIVAVIVVIQFFIFFRNLASISGLSGIFPKAQSLKIKIDCGMNVPVSKLLNTIHILAECGIESIYIYGINFHLSLDEDGDVFNPILPFNEPQDEK